MLKQGERVEHPSQPDWGVGQVLEDENSGRVRVYFGRLGDAKTLALDYIQLLRVVGPEADCPLLRNLKLSDDTPRRSARLPLSWPEAITQFLEDYPGGFAGERYQREERTYKDAAVALMDEQLGATVLPELLARKDYAEIATRARRLIGRTNLVFPNEAMALNDGLKDETQQRQFAEALADLLDGQDERMGFQRFADCLSSLGAAKWTIASYFQFLRWPNRRIFIKPTITRDIAQLWRKEIAYRPELNWDTYRAVQQMAEDARESLEREGLAPRDMIDVQSFMWCVANRM